MRGAARRGPFFLCVRAPRQPTVRSPRLYNSPTESLQILQALCLIPPPRIFVDYGPYTLDCHPDGIGVPAPDSISDFRKDALPQLGRSPRVLCRFTFRFPLPNQYIVPFKSRTMTFQTGAEVTIMHLTAEPPLRRASLPTTSWPKGAAAATGTSLTLISCTPSKPNFPFKLDSIFCDHSSSTTEAEGYCYQCHLRRFGSGVILVKEETDAFPHPTVLNTEEETLNSPAISASSNTSSMRRKAVRFAETVDVLPTWASDEYPERSMLCCAAGPEEVEGELVPSFPQAVPSNTLRAILDDFRVSEGLGGRWGLASGSEAARMVKTI